MNKRVVLITGAGSGMGQLAARRALDGGWAVSALDVNSGGLDALGNASHLLKLVVDVTDAVAVRNAVASTEDSLGPLDRVINAAAIMPLGLLMEQDQSAIHRIMNINYGGLVNVARATLPAMLLRHRGDFISFCSTAGHIPAFYMGAYNASKFAVSAFTEVLYHENMHSGIRFACVCPPMVATPLLDQAKETIWPKVFDQSPVISPSEVLDATEVALQRGEFWVWPGKGTKTVYMLRRLLPSMLWRRLHKVEGL